MVLGHCGELNVILESKEIANLVDKSHYALHLIGYLILCHINVSIVLSEATNSHKSVESARLFMSVNKTKFANYALAPYMPIKDIETISVFSQGTIAPNSKIKMPYNPQGTKQCHIEISNKPCDEAYRPNRKPSSYTQTATNYPRQLLTFANDTDNIHPTQKPVDLLRYLVLTYTNEGDTVLDNCMGSGTTAIACIKERRHFIGFELNKEYYDKACKRIKAEQAQLTLF
jgi:site-specific DNA-methyltransferase (adenine-specific)